MQQISGALRQGTTAAEVPFLVRFLGKLVLEVLPAAMASVIGAFLFAYYQFGQAAVLPPPEPAAAAVPASAAMVQLVRQEHAMIRDFIVAQQAAAKSRAEAADAADAEAAAEAKLAAAASQRGAALAAAKPPAQRGKPIVVASEAPSGTSTATAELPPVVIAGAQPNASQPPAAPQPAHASLVRRTLAVPRRVVAMTLHAVMAIGGIPSWIGRRVGAGQLDSEARSDSTAS
jgi:hypothetical protein